MAFFLETLIAGLFAGLMYGLVAIGFVLIYKASGVFNFAQGAMVFLAASAGEANQPAASTKASKAPVVPLMTFLLIDFFRRCEAWQRQRPRTGQDTRSLRRPRNIRCSR